LQEVKARYFSITKTLIGLRNDPNDPTVYAEMAKYDYNYGPLSQRHPAGQRYHY